MRTGVTVVGAIFAITLWRCCASTEKVIIDGAGASFPSEVYSTWMALYTSYRAPHVSLAMKYEAVGSWAGMARIKKEEGPPVHYVGCDSLLTDEDYEKHKDLQMFPTLVG